MQRPLILGLVIVGALLLGAALVLHLVHERTDQVASPPRPAAAAVPAPPVVAPPVAPSGAARAAIAPSFDVVRVNPSGDAVIAGRAEPGAEVTVREGDRVIGRVTADPRGEWVLLPSERLGGGHRELRLEATRPGSAPGGAPTASDQVVALDLPTAPAPVGGGPSAGSAVAGGTDQAVVQPGNSLWRLARERYGRGTEYGVIYQANRAQIRDPDLIYPGQVFVMPAER